MQKNKNKNKGSPAHSALSYLHSSPEDTRTILQVERNLLVTGHNCVPPKTSTELALWTHFSPLFQEHWTLDHVFFPHTTHPFQTQAFHCSPPELPARPCLYSSQSHLNLLVGILMSRTDSPSLSARIRGSHYDRCSLRGSSGRSLLQKGRV